jgi:hypothetical protein
VNRAAGKRIAVVIAYRAIQKSLEGSFATTAARINDLSHASREGRLVEARLTHTHRFLLVIDEVGYLIYGSDTGSGVFHVVNIWHLGRRAMIFAANKPLNTRGRVPQDPDLAAVILDRALERGRLFQLAGPPLRTRRLGRDDPITLEPSSQPVMVFGIDRPGFLEPTPTCRPRLPCQLTLVPLDARHLLKQPRADDAFHRGAPDLELYDDPVNEADAPPRWFTFLVPSRALVALNSTLWDQLPSAIAASQ